MRAPGSYQHATIRSQNQNKSIIPTYQATQPTGCSRYQDGVLRHDEIWRHTGGEVRSHDPLGERGAAEIPVRRENCQPFMRSHRARRTTKCFRAGTCILPDFIQEWGRKLRAERYFTCTDGYVSGTPIHRSS